MEDRGWDETFLVVVTMETVQKTGEVWGEEQMKLCGETVWSLAIWKENDKKGERER